jgi:hypothetical protein
MPAQNNPMRYDVGMTAVTYNHSGNPEGLYPYVYPSENGNYVLYTDYAEIASENELRKTEINKVIATHHECIRLSEQIQMLRKVNREQAHRHFFDINEIAAENDRLRKAGDDLMHGLLEYVDLTKKELAQLPPVLAWIAAKEGGAK